MDDVIAREKKTAARRVDGQGSLCIMKNYWHFEAELDSSVIISFVFKL